MNIGPTKNVFVGLFLAYPVIVYLGLIHFEARSVAVLLILLVGMRIIFVERKTNRRILQSQLIVLLLGAGTFGCVVLVTNLELLLLFYPVFINGIMLVLFSISLIYPPSIIERIARTQNAKLPRAAIRYTRKVTIVWCIFFIFNSVVASYTALFTTLETWALYNGIISYVLMGLLFFVEYLVRRYFQNKLVT